MGLFDVKPKSSDPKKLSAFKGGGSVSRKNADLWLKQNRNSIYRQLKGRVPMKDIPKLDEGFYDPKKYGPLIEKRSRERERALKDLQKLRRTTPSGQRWLVDEKMKIFKKFSEM